MRGASVDQRQNTNIEWGLRIISKCLNFIRRDAKGRLQSSTGWMYRSKIICPRHGEMPSHFLLRAYPKRGLTLSGEAKNPMKSTRLQRVRPLFGAAIRL